VARLPEASQRGFFGRPIRHGRVSLAEAVGNKGIVNVIPHLGMAQNYSGQTPLLNGEIDMDVENYLSTSEQIDSVLRCDTLVDGEARSSLQRAYWCRPCPRPRARRWSSSFARPWTTSD